MVRPVSNADRAVHQVSIATYDVEAVAKLAEVAAAMATRCDAVAAQLVSASRTMSGPSAARMRSMSRDMVRIGQSAVKISRQVKSRVNAAVEASAIASEETARRTLERRQKRPDQPDYFVGFGRGGTARSVGTRVRLRDSISSGVVSYSGLSFRVKVGVLDDLERAVDRQGKPVWPYVEYAWKNPGIARRGRYYPSMTAPSGSLRGTDAVLIPGAKGTGRARKAHKGHHFLEAGQKAAAATLNRRMAAVGGYATRELDKLNKRLAETLAEVSRIQASQRSAISRNRRR